MWGLDTPDNAFFVTAKEGYWTKVDQMPLTDFGIYVKRIDMSGERRRRQTNPGLASTMTKMMRAAAVLLGHLGRAEYRTYIQSKVWGAHFFSRSNGSFGVVLGHLNSP